ncbi:hypothetical protein ACFL3S_02110 [Gemmatimonadota bacterium]
MDEKIIDLRSFLEAAPGEKEGVLALWGGDEKRVRLAVPLWRAIFMVGGDRGGVVWVPEEGPQNPIPFFVLDLREDPARTSFASESLDLLRDREAPGLAIHPEAGIGALLGTQEGRRWHLVVTGAARLEEPETKVREVLLFLAGELAGLLFLWELAEEATSPFPSSV